MRDEDDRLVVALGMSPGLRSALFDDEAVRRIEKVGRVDWEQVVHAGRGPESSDPETEVLLTCWGAPRLDSTWLNAMPKLRAVIHAAGSVKGIVTEACRDRGIVVSSAAAVNAVPVAEFTVAMIVLSTKRVLWLADRYEHLGADWRPDVVSSDVGTFDRTIGICGNSLIGQRVIEMLRSYDVRVLLNDPYVEPAEAARLGVELVDLDELCARSDVVSLHAPALPSTRHLIDARRLGLMRDGATLINTARGVLVDTEALSRELVSGRLFAVLDHTDPEILPSESPLFGLPNVLVTPHIAGSLGTELRRLGSSAVDELGRFTAGEPFLHPVRYDDLGRSA